MTTHIERSKNTLKAIIVASTGAAFLGIFITIFLLSELRAITGLSLPVLRGLILFTFPLAWLASVVSAYKNWGKIKYYYDSNRLTIAQSRPFSGTETTSYGYESMGSVKLVQTKSGRKHNFGDIIIQLQNDQAPLVLRVIDDPATHASAIEKNIAEKKVYIAQS